MVAEKNDLYSPSKKGVAIRQGEILSNVKQIALLSESDGLDGGNEISIVEHPYCIVVSQDCDLDWDFRERKGDSKTYNSSKLLNCILFCEADTARAVRDNTNAGGWKKIPCNNEVSKFHFLERIPRDLDLAREGIPELVTNFRRIFAVESDYLYRCIESGEVSRRSVLVSPYLEHFCGRFHNYQGRIALPSQYESEKDG